MLLDYRMFLLRHKIILYKIGLNQNIKLFYRDSKEFLLT